MTSDFGCRKSQTVPKTSAEQILPYVQEVVTVGRNVGIAAS